MLQVRNFLSDESGVTAIEYALIASLIAVFIIAAVQLVGQQVSQVFTDISTTLK
jgi:pilus assembly protein Flp/PilA